MFVDVGFWSDVCGEMISLRVKKSVIFGLLMMVIAFVAVVLVISQRKPSSFKHETNRWAVIRDVNGDSIVVEPVNDGVWSELVQLYQSGDQKWVGGIVESYNSSWGFRFKPESIVVAEVTAEGLQATIRFISENLDYWKGGYAYVSGKVLEIHSQD